VSDPIQDAESSGDRVIADLVSRLTPDQIISIYIDEMDDKTKDRFGRASPNTKLDEELKLIRTVLASMTDNVNANSKRLSDGLVALLRAAAQEHKQREGTSDLDKVLTEIADKQLQAMEANGPRATLLQGSLLEDTNSAGSDENGDDVDAV